MPPLRRLYRYKGKTSLAQRLGLVKTEMRCRTGFVHRNRTARARQEGRRLATAEEQLANRVAPERREKIPTFWRVPFPAAAAREQRREEPEAE